MPHSAECFFDLQVLAKPPKHYIAFWRAILAWCNSGFRSHVSLPCVLNITTKPEFYLMKSRFGYDQTPATHPV